jgi:copper chaperone CopZ
MRTHLHLIAAATLSAATFLTGCSSGGAKGPASTAGVMDDTPIQGREAKLVVYGMSCPLCANNVDKTLLEVPGVTDVAVDMSTGIARVTLDGKTPVTPRQLATAVDRSGFSLQSIDTP